jgi:trimeric autotransporter adhesin
MKRFLPRLTYANVIASLALFIALGGAAVAAGLPKNSVGPNQIKKGAVTAKAIRKQAVTSGKIAPRAVTAGKLGANAVLPGNLGAGIISTDKIAASAVTAEKIRNNVVTTNKLNNKAVTSAKLAEKGVATGNLADGAVTAAKLANASVTKEKLAAGVIGNVETLKSGQTERGVFSLGGTKEKTKDASAFGSVSFQQVLAANPAAVVVVKKGETNSVCPSLGNGNTTPETAIAGVVCLYLTTETNLEGAGAAAVSTEANRLGVNLTAKGAKEAETGNFVASGVWAVTAP